MYSGPLHAGTAPRLCGHSTHCCGVVAVAPVPSPITPQSLPWATPIDLPDLPDRLPTQWPIHGHMQEQHVAIGSRKGHVGDLFVGEVTRGDRGGGCHRWLARLPRCFDSLGWRETPSGDAASPSYSGAGVAAGQVGAGPCPRASARRRSCRRVHGPVAEDS